MNSNNFNEDDDMPELDDLSEELSKIRQNMNKEEENSEIKVNIINNKNTSASTLNS